MSIIVTGGAGFIGSCIVRTLNDMGIEDIIIVDHISTTDKWKNMVNKNISSIFQETSFYSSLTALMEKSLM